MCIRDSPISLDAEKYAAAGRIKRSGLQHIPPQLLSLIHIFHQLNRANLKEFETYLRDKQLSWHTVSTYMRPLRATYNKAVDKKIITENSRLLHHVYTGVKNDIKRALEVEEINKLLNEVPLKKLPEDLILSLIHISGGGISYGYHIMLNRHWNIDVSVGVGYEYIDYKK